MKKLHILQLGIGNVGGNLVKQIIAQQEEIRKKLRIDLKYCGLFNSNNGVFKEGGFSIEEVENLIIKLDRKEAGDISNKLNQAISASSIPFVLLDLTASDTTVPFLKLALEKKGYVVLSNKKPLSGKLQVFNDLHRVGKVRLFYETLVGAGLPVIQTLKNLIDSGDEIIEINGCFSGTLGFISSQLEDGKLFSEAVLEAKEKGFTEPDPRDDLSGLDVARKALILSRIVGQKTELRDIELVGLYPVSMQKLNSSDFLMRLEELDSFYKEKVDKAKKKNRVLRYVAKISSMALSVGLQEVDVFSDIGSLKGPDNLIVFKTKRYFKYPLVIKGPGAGGEVTAAGVFADVLSIAKTIKGGFYE